MKSHIFDILLKVLFAIHMQAVTATSHQARIQIIYSNRLPKISPIYGRSVLYSSYSIFSECYDEIVKRPQVLLLRVLSAPFSTCMR